MGYKIAIDFGTTNSIVARWNERDNTPEIVSVPLITNSESVEDYPIIPSLVYIHNHENAIIGQAVRDQQLDIQEDNRLFRNFKRGIVTDATTGTRKINGSEFTDRDAGKTFVQKILQALPHNNDDIDQLILTAPVAAFEGYLDWLSDIITHISHDKIRIVDESTAAALGYAVTKPGAVVLVFDFGGGTLDLSLVQLPEHRRKTGGFLRKLIESRSDGSRTAKVIAKAGRVIGGSDIDQWILGYVLGKTGLTPQDLGKFYTPALTMCEQAKIDLSTKEDVTISFEIDGQPYSVDMTRNQLELLLEENGFYDALRRVVDKVMHVARQRGIFKEDIHYVLMVGGTSLMPSVQNTLGHYFTDMAVRADKPFTAVAEGALQVAAGQSLDDYLVHSYGLRVFNPETGQHDWDEIISMGSRYPLEQPINVMLSSAHEQQQEVEFIIGEIDTDSVSMIEVQYEDGQAVFVAQANDQEQKIHILNENEAAGILARLNPHGKAGEERLQAQFTIDDQRKLRITVVDIKSNQILLDNQPVATLR